MRQVEARKITSGVTSGDGSVQFGSVGHLIQICSTAVNKEVKNI